MSTCQVGLKECAIAMQIYANDYNGCLPSSALVRGSSRWSRRDFAVFATRRGAHPPLRGKRARTWPEALYPCMTNRDWMFCPSDATDRSDPRSQVSYWWKCAVDKAWYGEACSKAFRKLNDFYYYADDVLLYEHRGWHFGDERGLKNGIQINAVFLDTHVKTAGLVNSTTHYTQNPTAYGEPMYFNCDMKKPCSRWNPPAESLPARYVDPGRYSDILR